MKSQEMSEKSGKSSNVLASDKVPKSKTSADSGRNCAVCNSPIVGKVVSALGKFYHPRHFVCSQCNEELEDQFLEKNGKIYCQNDYHMLFSPKCCKCEKPIIEKCVTALEKVWHPEHFQCENCGEQFGENTGFHEKDGKAYCRKDFLDLFAKKCFKCKNAIEEKCITAIKQTWHPNCFQCENCKEVLGNDSLFLEKNGKPYCREDYLELFAPKCFACAEPITEKFILAEDHQWHPDCYNKK